MSADPMTPMVKQYLRIKDIYNDAILLYRVGDFYEMFFEDAVIASKLLDITLTSRNKDDENSIPLCGVPYHSVEPYIAKLVSLGKKVAICDQVEDPKTAKGVVKREVTRVITPGVVLEGEGIEAGRNNYLAAVIGTPHPNPLPHGEREMFGLAVADVSTGHFSAAQFDTMELLMEELARLEVREILVPAGLADQFPVRGEPVEPRTGMKFNFSPLDRLRVNGGNALTTPFDEKHFDSRTISRLEGASRVIAAMPAAARAAGAIWSYVTETQKGEPLHIRQIETRSASKTMRLDDAAKRNLELFRTMIDGSAKGTLAHLLDRTSTAMGARELKEWILYPLMDCEAINARLNAVEGIAQGGLVRELPPLLSKIYDLERIAARISMGTASARDMVGLKNSINEIPVVARTMAEVFGHKTQDARRETKVTGLESWVSSLDCLTDISSQIDKTIVDEPPLSLREGGLIKRGVSSELDDLRSISSGGKDSIARIEERERARTGIGSLKVKYNRVFGYYIEITNTHRDKVPADYIRKQTLVNAERYVTPELKDFEERVLAAEDKIRSLEYDIFSKLRQEIAGEIERITRAAEAIAVLDVLTSFAVAAVEYKYVRPVVNDRLEIRIMEGRHPIIERLDPVERFVPNDVALDGADKRLLMITGPNMAGKSTVMRQTALIVLMAQMGSFVPAKEATIGIVDRIFTRIGASDALSLGRSTFMVEMNEAAAILKEATERSLVVIDEIGRGTSTFDGLSIAWAIAEDLHDRVRARTLFATHYHELTELALTKEGIGNFNIAVKEWNGQVIFLRKLVPGGTSRSYGIQVAKLAGLPESVIARSHEVLKNLEEGELDEIGKPRLAHHGAAAASAAQMNLFCKPINLEIAEKLETIDTSTLTPIEAINILHELKQKM